MRIVHDVYIHLLSFRINFIFQTNGIFIFSTMIFKTVCVCVCAYAALVPHQELRIYAVDRMGVSMTMTVVAHIPQNIFSLSI